MKEKYDLLDKIRGDAFGIIYKAKLKYNDELREIKIINKKNLINNLGKEKANDFFNHNLENMTICCQNNINSVKLYEYFNTENELVLVMELVDEDLEQFLKKKKQGLKSSRNIRNIKTIK